MSWQDRFCPKHPRQKMTVLFSSVVCDVCEPPKRNKEVSFEFRYSDTAFGIDIAARDSEHYLVCQKCWNRFSSWMPSMAAISGTDPGLGHARCSCGNSEKISLSTGDRIECSQVWMQNGKKSEDYEWNGKNFIMVKGKP